MFTRCVAAVLALVCSSATQSDVPARQYPSLGTMNADMPPERFRGDSASIVVFTGRAGIDAMCGVAEPPYTIIACTRKLKDGTPIVFMPNPCAMGAEFFARIMCHENGHVNGWSGEHED